MKLGETYFWRDHLWIVISLPADNGSVVIVNFTTWRMEGDHSCVVEVGEHPFIEHKTEVAYKWAKILATGEQKEFVETAEPRDPVSPDLLQKIQSGTDSDFIPQDAARAVLESSRRQRQAQ